jgi:hypothetical protein
LNKKRRNHNLHHRVIKSSQHQRKRITLIRIEISPYSLIKKARTQLELFLEVKERLPDKDSHKWEEGTTNKG